MASSITPAVVDAASGRLLAGVDALPATDWPGDTYCTGWSRAHVIAHLALNAEGLAGVLEGLQTGEPRTMYASNERRDADIEELAAAGPGEIRDRLRTAVERFRVGWSTASVDDEQFERTPGGQLIRAGAIGFMRLREVEIHHADLDAGYSWSDWPEQTVAAFLDNSAKQYDGPGFHVMADGRTWTFGDPGDDAPTVTGPAAAVAWWATGRPLDDAQTGPVLSSTTGTLPTMEGR